MQRPPNLAEPALDEGEDTLPSLEGPETEPEFTRPDFPSEMVPDPTRPPAPPGRSGRQALTPREPRYAAELPVRFGEGVALDTYGSTGNVSRRGLELKGHADLTVGEKVSFVLRLPDLTFVRGVGEVMWKKNRRAVGVFGIAVLVADPGYWAFLDRLERTPE